MLSFDWPGDTGKKDIRRCIMARYLSCCAFRPRVWRKVSRRAAFLHIEPMQVSTTRRECLCHPNNSIQKNINSAICLVGSAIVMIIKPFFLLQDMVIAPTGAVIQVHLGG